jgi:hypothetical protein
LETIATEMEERGYVRHITSQKGGAWGTCIFQITKKGQKHFKFPLMPLEREARARRNLLGEGREVVSE